MRHDDYISEGEALSDWLEGEDDDVFVPVNPNRALKRDLEAVQMYQAIEAQRKGNQARYDAVKAAKVGSHVACPYCQKQFKKRSYQHTFCSNKGRQNCKDKFWNMSTDDRLVRALAYGDM